MAFRLSLSYDLALQQQMAWGVATVLPRTTAEIGKRKRHWSPLATAILKTHRVLDNDGWTPFHELVLYGLWPALRKPMRTFYAEPEAEDRVYLKDQISAKCLKDLDRWLCIWLRELAEFNQMTTGLFKKEAP